MHIHMFPISVYKLDRFFLFMSLCHFNCLEVFYLWHDSMSLKSVRHTIFLLFKPLSHLFEFISSCEVKVVLLLGFKVECLCIGQ